MTAAGESDVDGGVTGREAAMLLGLTTDQVSWLGRRGHLTPHRRGRRVFYDRAEVAAYARRHTGWVSYAMAARIAGCSPTTVGNAVARGELVGRPGPRQHPCLCVASVARWAAELQQRRARTAAERGERDLAAERRRRSLLPPEEDGVWLSLETAAVVMGMSTSGVAARARQGRVPATRVGRRWWFRREHIESAAAARVFAARQARARLLSGVTMAGRPGEAGRDAGGSQ